MSLAVLEVRPTPGMFATSHCACANGTIMSAVPCHTATGTVMSRTEKPHGRMWVRSSSRQPAMPCASACRNPAAVGLGELPGQRGPVHRRDQAAEGVRDLGGGDRRQRRCECSSSSAVRGSGPAKAAVYSATFSSPIPARMSPSYSVGGASPTPQTAARHRSGSIAAQASERGPPPDQPSVTNRSCPRWSRTWRRRRRRPRPWRRWPRRSAGSRCRTRGGSRRRAAARGRPRPRRAAGPARRPGECRGGRRAGTRPGCPDSSTSRVRPSGVVTCSVIGPRLCPECSRSSR